MRGCFYVLVDGFHRYTVLPAYAGMFLSIFAVFGSSAGSPRVCGDASLFVDFFVLVSGFSPRMRGCFLRLISHSNHTLVLPAYAGLFLFLKAWRQNYSGYSRAKEIIRHHAVYSACSLAILTIGTAISQFIYTIQMVVYEKKI